MSLIPEWKRVLKRAWSMRLMAVAGLLSGGEVVIQTYGAEWLPIPQWARASLIMGVIGGAFVARIVAQRGIGDDSAE
jgi:hypothetical protein